MLRVSGASLLIFVEIVLLFRSLQIGFVAAEASRWPPRMFRILFRL